MENFLKNMEVLVSNSQYVRFTPEKGAVNIEQYHIAFNMYKEAENNKHALCLLSPHIYKVCSYLDKPDFYINNLVELVKKIEAYSPYRKDINYLLQPLDTLFLIQTGIADFTVPGNLTVEMQRKYSPKSQEDLDFFRRIHKDSFAIINELSVLMSLFPDD